MTVIELAISTFLLIMLSGSLTAALVNVRGVFQEGTIQSRMQDAGERALKVISEDLRRSGFVQVGGLSYPFVFPAGVPGPSFAAHAHAPAVQNAQAGDPDFGASSEIVFVQPDFQTDAAGDEVPQLDGLGALQWDDTEISYVLMTGADGVNYLQRRTNAANPRRLAGHVERLVFEAPGQIGVTIPNDSVRIRIFFRQVDEKGVVHRHQAEATVALRNTPAP